MGERKTEIRKMTQTPMQPFVAYATKSCMGDDSVHWLGYRLKPVQAAQQCSNAFGGRTLLRSRTVALRRYRFTAFMASAG